MRKNSFIWQIWQIWLKGPGFNAPLYLCTLGVVNIISSVCIDLYHISREAMFGWVKWLYPHNSCQIKMLAGFSCSWHFTLFVLSYLSRRCFPLNNRSFRIIVKSKKNKWSTLHENRNLQHHSIFYFSSACDKSFRQPVVRSLQTERPFDSLTGRALGPGPSCWTETLSLLPLLVLLSLPPSLLPCRPPLPLRRCDAAPRLSIPDSDPVPRSAGQCAGRGAPAVREGLRGAGETGFRWDTAGVTSAGACFVTSHAAVFSVFAQWRCAASSRCCCYWWSSWPCASTSHSTVAEKWLVKKRPVLAHRGANGSSGRAASSAGCTLSHASTAWPELSLPWWRNSNKHIE